MTIEYLSSESENATDIFVFIPECSMELTTRFCIAIAIFSLSNKTHGTRDQSTKKYGFLMLMHI